MRAVVQRVTRAEVTSDVGGVPDGGAPDGGAPDGPPGWESVGAIGAGLCVFVGATHGDDDAAAVKLARKIWGLRILDDAAGVMNRSLSDVHGDGSPAEALVVSQFTLYGDTAKGRRPSWIAAARPEQAEPLVERVVEELRALGATVATGRFRTEMHVDLVNDGPVTLVLDV